MTSKETGTYDTAEASDLLARSAQTIRADHYFSDAIAAAEELLKAVKSLDNKTVIMIGESETRFGPRIAVATLNKEVLLFRDDEGRIQLRNSKVSELRFVDGLEFNPATLKWEGKAFDTFRTPVPGEPRQRRSAVAVVIEAVIAELSTPV